MGIQVRRPHFAWLWCSVFLLGLVYACVNCSLLADYTWCLYQQGFCSPVSCLCWRDGWHESEKNAFTQPSWFVLEQGFWCCETIDVCICADMCALVFFFFPVAIACKYLMMNQKLKQCFSCLAARDQFTQMYTCLKCHSFYKCPHSFCAAWRLFSFFACKELVELKYWSLLCGFCVRVSFFSRYHARVSQFLSLQYNRHLRDLPSTRPAQETMKTGICAWNALVPLLVSVCHSSKYRINIVQHPKSPLSVTIAHQSRDSDYVPLVASSAHWKFTFTRFLAS